MDLTTWQRICNRILGRLLRKRARRDKELSESLVKGSMPMMPEVYLATVIVTSIAIALISWGVVGIFFFPEIGVIAFYEGIQDASSVAPCFEWEYWNPDMVNNALPGNGCPEYTLQVFPPFLKILIILIIPF